MCAINDNDTHMDVYRHLIVQSCTVVTKLLDVRTAILDRNVEQYCNFAWTHLNLSWGETIWCCFKGDVLNVQAGTPI